MMRLEAQDEKARAERQQRQARVGMQQTIGGREEPVTAPLTPVETPKAERLFGFPQTMRGQTGLSLELTDSIGRGDLR